MTKLTNLYCLATLLSLSPICAVADEVTTTSVETGIPVTGELLSYDNEFLVLDTSFGPLKFLRTSVSCEGAACPTNGDGLEETELVSPVIPSAGSILATDGPAITLKASVAPDHVVNMMNGLLKGYASTFDLVPLNYPNASGGVGRIDLVEPSTFGDPLGSFEFVSMETEDALDDMYAGNLQLTLAEYAAARSNDDLSAHLKNMATTILGLDAVVLAVHPDNTLDEISINDVAKLLNGQIDNWSDLGGPGLPIQLVLPEAGSSLDHVLKSSALLAVDHAQLTSAIRATAKSPAVDTVMEDRAAISLMHFTDIESAKPVALIDECGNRHTANPYSIRTEEYPLSTRVYAMAQGNDATTFLDYAASADGQQHLLAAGKIDQTIETQPLLRQTARLNYVPEESSALTALLSQNFVNLVSDAERLTTTFRFEGDTSTPDAKSAADMTRLSAYLSDPELASKDVLVIGFGDNTGTFDAAAQRANDDANAILEKLLGNAPDGQTFPQNISAMGFGFLSPVACNKTLSGRNTNRRVEIWIK